MSGKRKWIAIAIGVVILLFFVAVGAVIFTVSYARDHLQVSNPSREDAMRAFDEVHAKFPWPALIEIRDGEAVRVADRATEPVSKTTLTTLHVLAWDADEERLARVDVPFWLLRMKSGPISFGSYASGFDERIRLRPEDIEKHGPGIVVDFTDSRRDRGRAMVWAD